MDLIGIENVAERFHIVTPENSEFFQKNKMALSDLLFYSPLAIERINYLVDGRFSYIIGGFPGVDDIRLALALNSSFYTGNPIQNKRFT